MGLARIPSKGDWVQEQTRYAQALANGSDAALDECVEKYHGNLRKLSLQNPDDPELSYLVVIDSAAKWPTPPTAGARSHDELGMALDA